MTPAELAQHGLLWLAPNVEFVGIIVFSWFIGVCVFVGTAPAWWRDW